jgi:hypothetical protein
MSLDATYPASTKADSMSQITTTGFQGTRITMMQPPGETP